MTVQIGKCRYCSAAIVNKSGQWVHLKSKSVHCSDALMSSVARPVVHK